MHIEWNDMFSIGIEELDAHHKKLIELLNKSYSLIVQENIQSELTQLLDELIDYAKYHFTTEEKLMQRYYYPEIDAHMVEHFSFSNKLLTYQKETKAGKKYVSIDIFDFIKHWLMEHEVKIDFEMGKFILIMQ